MIFSRYRKPKRATEGPVGVGVGYEITDNPPQVRLSMTWRHKGVDRFVEVGADPATARDIAQSIIEAAEKVEFAMAEEGNESTPVSDIPNDQGGTT